MSRHYIPRRDLLALGWMKNFASTIAAGPGVYALEPAQAASIQSVVDAYNTAFYVATAPGTRTSSTVIVKDQARNTAEQLCRVYASQIKANAGIDDADKIAVGVRPVNRARTKINVPMASPALGVIGAAPNQHVLRYGNGDCSFPAKPFGAIQLQLFVAITPDRNGTIDDARFCGAYTKNPMAVTFTPDDEGKIAKYWGRWISLRGDVGPWSLPTSMRIAA